MPHYSHCDELIAVRSLECDGSPVLWSINRLFKTLHKGAMQEHRDLHSLELCFWFLLCFQGRMLRDIRRHRKAGLVCAHLWAHFMLQTSSFTNIHYNTKTNMYNKNNQNGLEIIEIVVCTAYKVHRKGKCQKYKSTLCVVKTFVCGLSTRQS